MKTKIGIFALISLIFFSVQPALAINSIKPLDENDSLRQQYLKKRYNYFDCGTSWSKFYIDMADVATVYYDATVFPAIVYFSFLSVSAIASLNNWTDFRSFHFSAFLFPYGAPAPILIQISVII